MDKFARNIAKPDAMSIKTTRSNHARAHVQYTLDENNRVFGKRFYVM